MKAYPVWTTDGQRVTCATTGVSVDRRRPANGIDPAPHVTIGDVKQLDGRCSCKRHHWSKFESEHLAPGERMARIEVESGVRA